jgi:hypothetical protein
MKTEGGTKMFEYAREEFPHSVTLKKAIEEEKYVDVQYGFFNGGDPRDFNPDLECCSEEEVARWHEAVSSWNIGARVEYAGSHFWIHDANDKIIGSGTNATFGIGTYLCVYDHDPMDQSKCEHHYQNDFYSGKVCACCGFGLEIFDPTEQTQAEREV